MRVWPAVRDQRWAGEPTLMLRVYGWRGYIQKVFLEKQKYLLYGNNSFYYQFPSAGTTYGEMFSGQIHAKMFPHHTEGWRVGAASGYRVFHDKGLSFIINFRRPVHRTERMYFHGKPFQRHFLLSSTCRRRYMKKLIPIKNPCDPQENMVLL